MRPPAKESGRDSGSFMDREKTERAVPSGGAKLWLRRAVIPAALCLAAAFVVITLVSKSSFLYPFNDWVDAQWYMSMGHGIVDGKVPYRDLFEQKGVLIYMLFAFAYLIGGTSFIGVWLLEIVFAAAFLFLSYRIGRLYFTRKVCLLLIVPESLLTYGAAAFALGGGAVEEYCLPLLSYGLLVFLRCAREARGPRRTETVLLGVFAACIFWIKYTILVFYAVLVVFFFVDRLMRKDGKGAAVLVCLFLAGLAAASLPWLAYFAVNGALDDLWQVYILDNFLYASAGGVNVLPRMLERMLENFFLSVLFLAALAAFMFCSEVAPRYRVGILLAAVLLFVAQGVIGKQYVYYYLVLAVFIPVGIYGLYRMARYCLHALRRAWAAPSARQKARIFPSARGAMYGDADEDLFSDTSARLQRVRFSRAVCIGVLALALAVGGSLLFGNCTSELFLPPQTYPQTAVAERIEQEGGGVLLSYKMYDYGFYSACDQSPGFYYFAQNNFNRKDFPQLFEGQESYVTEARPDFVVTERSVYEEEKDTLLSRYEAIGEYSYRHVENNYDIRDLQFVLLARR